MGYITEERIDTLRHTVITGAECDVCKIKLSPVGDPDNKLWVGSLDVILSGGYGQFFDDKDVRVLFCEGCAQKLLAAFPSLAKAMKEQETW